MIRLLCSAWWPPILQTAIGAMGAIAGGTFGSWLTWQRERKSVAAAFAGEVQAIIDVVEWRQTREGLLQGHVFPIDDHPFPVFEANVGKIGLLPPDLAAKVAGFYSRAGGMVQDFRALSMGTPIRNEGEIRARLAESIEPQEIEAEALVSALQKEAARSWKDLL